jgi:HK97 gp10 family phage protein
MARRSGFAGVTKLRKTLRRLEPEATEGIKDAMLEGAERIQRDALVNLRSQLSGRSEGELERSITYKMGRDKMTAVIGPGAKHVKITKNPFDTTQYKSKPSKRSAMNFFKGYWFEFGTKGHPESNIPPQRARPYMNPAFDSNKNKLVKEVQAEIREVLRDLTDG